MFEEIDRLIEDREGDYPNNLLKARELLLPLVEGEAARDVYLRLAETLFWLGEYSENNEDKEKYFNEGVQYGEKAVKVAEDSAGAHMWYASVLGSYGVVRGIMSSLASMKTIETHGNKSMELDDSYYYSGPLRLMGRFYHQAPPWPLGSGDTKKAIQILEKACLQNPDFYYNQIYLADALLSRNSKGDKEEARKLIELVKSSEANPKYPRHFALIQADADKVAEKL